MCEGEESPETSQTKSLMVNPAGQRNSGASQRWKIAKKLVPKVREVVVETKDGRVLQGSICHDRKTIYYYLPPNPLSTVIYIIISRLFSGLRCSAKESYSILLS